MSHYDINENDLNCKKSAMIKQEADGTYTMTHATHNHEHHHEHEEEDESDTDHSHSPFKKYKNKS